MGFDEGRISVDEAVSSVCEEEVRDPVLRTELLDDIEVETDKVEGVLSEVHTEVALEDKLLVGTLDAEVEMKLVEVDSTAEELLELIVEVDSKVLELVALLREVELGIELLISLLGEVGLTVEVPIELLVTAGSEVEELIALVSEVD